LCSSAERMTLTVNYGFLT